MRSTARQEGHRADLAFKITTVLETKFVYQVRSDGRLQSCIERIDLYEVVTEITDDHAYLSPEFEFR